MPEKFEKHLIIPKHKLVSISAELTVEEYIDFATIIHSNNLGLAGIVIQSVSEIIDQGDRFIVKFECMNFADVKADVAFQQHLQQMASTDIDKDLKKYKEK